ncbi:O-fucosyltransferase 24 [Cocos nucifera]|uniref:O-fucosyltransferase family protein n=1 Tax=Cocos nucifera TaxID=13894 RepID=A0A8K0MUY0_COCNU|nr:O-fucosyltransferase 24 [Cocos nucifera]
MSSLSYISITQNLISLKPFLKSSKTSLSSKLLLRTPRQASRYFIPLLAFWAVLNISQLLLSHPPACSRHPHHHHLRQNAQKLDNFWKWAYSGVPNVRPCLDFSESYRNSSLKGRSPKYMMAVVSGGLNQQRNQIIDAVVVARILGAVLVVPVLQVNQVWGDESEFGDIFDVQHFKQTLKDDVVVTSSLPSTHLRNRRVRSPVMPFNADEHWVRENYVHKLGRETVLLLRAFDSRLTKNLKPDLQKLRCKVAFEALKFQPWIQEIADKFIKRMKKDGPYMALHLRLEKDVWVRTGCHSGLGKEADLVIANERASNPQFLTSRSKLTPQQRYHAGLCPLNANDISRLLKGLGASRKTRIYWAGGEPFGGQDALKPLQSQFPNLFNKWGLAGPGELDGIKHKPSVMAALDYAVCLESQFFMASHGGNMARSLQGHRTYMSHGKHIRPNKKLLVKIFMDKGASDDEMEKRIKQIHTVSVDGASVLTNNTNIDVIGFPIPYCMCSRERTS